MSEGINNLSQVGRKAIFEQDWATLEKVAHEAVDTYPREPESHFLIGKLFALQQKIKPAISAFTNALKLDDNRYDAAIELGHLYVLSKRNGEAAELVRTYQQHLNNSPYYLSLAAVICDQISLPETAYRLHKKAYELQPEINTFKANLAASCVFLGKTSEAKALYEELMQSSPSHQRNHYFYSRLQTAQDDSHVSQMKTVLEKESNPAEKNIYMYYAIAKELEDLQRWDESFFYYKMAGDAATQVANYDVNEDLDILQSVIDNCTNTWMQKDTRRQEREAEVTPIFIVGLPRTGTTLLERMLSSHSQISTLGESQFVPMLIRNISNINDKRKVSPEIIASAAEKDISQLAQMYLAAAEYRLDKTKPYFIEKLPLNFIYLGFIKKAFPNAKFIYMQRNPMDACFAMYKQVFTWAYKFSYNLENLGHYYKKHVELLDHWRNVFGDDLIEISYEKLVTQSETEVEALFSAMNINFEPECLAFYNNTAPSTTASSVQVREKLHSNSIDKWRSFEAHLKPLKEILLDAGIKCD
ncbi:tetratricopeptide repeat-containing sulfotransferase family protein [Alteromonas sp. ASW11-130]|uniref:tetratricopeptide repeat-containing sulfotransferase family protein n=1 Tax=Alteromonas sp. ASW11-130 TaxID=3015775 RepID=UPI002242AAC8|nr:tetratricopeptide repeat-containing sulfotransferase family protein [Alteromonas sp. ASW11-130]MCW8091957.1 sulfotransferase [Alteromonas sp. ASW11-130]